MNERLCTRCDAREATSLGVPISERLDRNPDGTPLARNSVIVRHDPATWTLLCDACVDSAIAAGELALVHDLATFNGAPLPTEIRTTRLLLRPWRRDDAEQLQPILEANYAHLSPWIPTRIATPASVPDLERRLAGFAADFTNDREWRYAIFTHDGSGDSAQLLGELSLFPRAERGRVPFAEANCAEVGYWLRADATGHGYVVEACKGVLGAVARIPRFSHAEIICDERNAQSAAVPQRLGFVLTNVVPDSEPGVQLQIWTSALGAFRVHRNERGGG
ncbi:MAG: GNAT family N-acetyltransferase [bacterium]